MLIKKDTILEVDDTRKGKYIGIAIKDFDTENEWYSIAVHQDKPVMGMNKDWFRDDDIPARKSLCKITVL